MATLVPRLRPQIKVADAIALVEKLGFKRKSGQVVLLGCRGYYRDTLGVPGKNDIGLYDDALILISRGIYLTVNANTDPSRTGESMATLDEGFWSYMIGKHHRDTPQAYTALVQAAEVRVLRHHMDGRPPTPDTGYFGINIHRGGMNGTSSLGCQTVYPDQWPHFISTVQEALASECQKILPYILTSYTQ